MAASSGCGHGLGGCVSAAVLAAAIGADACAGDDLGSLLADGAVGDSWGAAGDGVDLGNLGDRGLGLAGVAAGGGGRGGRGRRSRGDGADSGVERDRLGHDVTLGAVGHGGGTAGDGVGRGGEDGGGYPLLRRGHGRGSRSVACLGAIGTGKTRRDAAGSDGSRGGGGGGRHRRRGDRSLG